MTTYTWTGASGNGDWNDAGNWSPSTGFPNAYGDEALITAAGNYTVTISGESYSVGVLQMAGGATLALQSATLTVYPSDGGANLSDLGGTITVDGASTINFEDTWTTAQLGTIDAASGATLDFAGTLDNSSAIFVVGAGVLLKGAIDGGTIEGTIGLGDNHSLTLEGAPTLTGAGGSGDGLIEDTGSLSTLRLQNTETLANTTIDIGNSSNYSYLTQADSNGGGQIATLASSVTVNVAGFAYFTGSSEAGDALVNQGAINVTTTGANLTISNPIFTNDGTIDVANSSYLTFYNGNGVDFTNDGTLSVDGTSTVQFEGLTTAQLGTFDATSGATVYFAGTGLDNSGATFDVVPGVVLEGAITGGAIDGVLNISAGQLNALGLAGSPTLTGANGSGSGTINNYGNTLDLNDTQTIDNTTINLYGGYITQTNASTVTTLGSGDIVNIYGNATIDGGATGAGLINQGAIDDGANEVTLTDYAYSFTNEGTMDFSDHNAFVVALPTNGTFTNAATGTIEASVGANGASYMLFQSSIVNDGTITVDGESSPTQQAYVDYYYGVTGSGATDVANGGLADFFQSQTQKVNFTGGGGTLQLNANANTGAVSGFTSDDTINLTSLLWDNGAVNWSLGANNVLTVTNGGLSATVQLDPSANYSGYVFHLADDNSGLPGGDGTDVTATPCFCRGVLLRTPDGAAAVETLLRGDLVLTTDGEAKRVCWIGRRAVSAIFSDPTRSWPIRVKAGALGDSVPSRDLLLSPDHALLVEDVLIQAGALVNGTSIVRETKVPETFVYYHVELDDHSLILAENTPAETFVDNVDRLGFDNWAEHEALYPDGKPIDEMPYPRAKACRQVPIRIRAMLDARAKNIVAAEAFSAVA
ncbi:Hint domain-containing protein [Rhodoblastus sp.]|uniref:Hint domain-containing protein n=1 Tax=Rhodoblastus sp. TaxID=1962975 RepID=UPI003F9D4CAC